MEQQVANIISRQMEQCTPPSLDFLIRKSPTECLQMVDSADDNEQEIASMVSSRLSDPFSEYIPLEVPSSPAGLQGHLAKFSDPFQVSVKEALEKTSGEDAMQHSNCENISVTDLSSMLSLQLTSPGSLLELEIPDDLLPHPPDKEETSATRRLSACADVSTRADSLTSGLWSMLEQYSEFRLSVQEEGSHSPQQVSLVESTRESALIKCAAWLDKMQIESSSSAIAAPRSAIQSHDAEDNNYESSTSTPEKKLSKSREELRSKWKREKNLIMACRSNNS